MTRPVPPDPAPERRCAIYTRRSVEPQPHQEFNSLEAQRAICSAYITSQRHKGWIEVAKRYDDAGRSGASLDRPQLQSLLADVENGLIDVVVVYKLDRMTRTLLDFVRLTDFFERHGTVFVSITQNFDTADSMGRLILNVLLTFAQFERELASDRVRDKVRLMKQAGRWTGGPAPLGYDNCRKRLRVNEGEAAIVRQIFRRYIELQNANQVYAECRKAGYCSKQWRTRAGHLAGGGPMTKTLIQHMLVNPVYIGELRNNGERFQGLHAPIIDRETWDQVQAIKRARSYKKVARNKENILTDLLFDCFGRPMCVRLREVPGRSVRASRFYASCQTVWGGRQQLRRLSAKADGLEELVVASVRNFVGSREQVRSMLLGLSYHDAELDRLARRCSGAGKLLGSLTRPGLRLALKAMVVRIELSIERVKIVLRLFEVVRFLRWDGVGYFSAQKADWPRSPTQLIDVPAGAIRYFRRLEMPVEPKPLGIGAHPAPGLRRLIHEARELQRLVDTEREKSLAELANQVQYSPHRFARVLRLNYLAPDIVLSILDGTHPCSLTRRQLVQASLPMDWALQRQLLGFPPRRFPEGGE